MGQFILQKIKVGTAADDAPWVDYPAEYVSINGNETAMVMLEKLYGNIKFFKLREDRESHQILKVKSGQHNIPPNIDGKFLFVVEEDATEEPTIALPDNLNNMLGLEIIIISYSATYGARFRSYFDLFQIRLDAGSPLIYSTTVTPQSTNAFIITDHFALGY